MCVKTTEMKYTSQAKQLTIGEFWSSLVGLDKSNRWVMLGDFMPWAKIEKLYNSKLHNQDRGAGNKPARIIIGAVIIKHKLSLSDEETIQMIRENPYMQYFVGLSEFTDRPIFDPSLFVTVRKRIGVEDFNSMSVSLLEKQVKQMEEAEKRDGKGDKGGEPNGDSPDAEEGSRKETKKEDLGKEFTDEQERLHKGVLKIDATCSDAEVRYPTDVDLVHEGCRVINRYIDKICGTFGLPRPVCHYKSARHEYLPADQEKSQEREADQIDDTDVASLSSCRYSRLYGTCRSINALLRCSLFVREKDSDSHYQDVSSAATDADRECASVRRPYHQHLPTASLANSQGKGQSPGRVRRQDGSEHL